MLCVPIKYTPFSISNWLSIPPPQSPIAICKATLNSRHSTSVSSDFVSARQTIYLISRINWHSTQRPSIRGQFGVKSTDTIWSLLYWSPKIIKTLLPYIYHLPLTSILRVGLEVSLVQFWLKNSIVPTAQCEICQLWIWVNRGNKYLYKSNDVLNREINGIITVTS